MFVDIGPYTNNGSDRSINIEIDGYDVWSMDHTLGLIVLPMLKKLQEIKHGSPDVEDDDVPDNLKSINAPSKENKWDTDENWHERWEWVLNEMIWAFEQIVDDDNDAQFHTGVIDFNWKKLPNGSSEMLRGPNDTHVFDAEGCKTHYERIKRGTTLFGKYYRGLWD